MIKKFLITAFTLIISTSNALSNGFIGVIGVAVGEINNQKNEKLLNGSKIFYGDTIIVKSKSNAQILFLDETVLTVGENTELTIDDFIYDPKTNDGNFVTNIKSGTVKFITGKISKKNPDNLEVNASRDFGCKRDRISYSVKFKTREHSFIIRPRSE